MKNFEDQRNSVLVDFSVGTLRVCPQYFQLLFHYFLINLQIFRISPRQKFWMILLGFTSSLNCKLLIMNLFNKSS